MKVIIFQSKIVLFDRKSWLATKNRDFRSKIMIFGEKLWSIGKSWFLWHVRDFFGTSSWHVWIIFGTCSKHFSPHFCNMFGIWLGRFRCMFGQFSAHFQVYNLVCVVLRFTFSDYGVFRKSCMFFFVLHGRARPPCIKSPSVKARAQIYVGFLGNLC